MTTKFDRSDICKAAWHHARCIARDLGISVRAALSQGFKTAWNLAKFRIAMASQPRPVAALKVRREDQATFAQTSYIASLGGTYTSGLTKRAASALIDQLKAAKQARRATATRVAEEPYSPEEFRRIQHIRRTTGCIVD